MKKRTTPRVPVLEVFVTFPSRQEAERITRIVIRNKYAACANTWPIRSTFLWNGKMARRNEVAALFKTTTHRYSALERKIRALHSDKIPCIIAWPIVRGCAPYLRWVQETIHG